MYASVCRECVGYDACGMQDEYSVLERCVRVCRECVGSVCREYVEVVSRGCVGYDVLGME